jgi:hypothetical protein
LLGFLDESMKDDDTPTKQEAIESTTDARLAAPAKLKQAIAEGARSLLRPILGHFFAMLPKLMLTEINF